MTKTVPANFLGDHYFGYVLLALMPDEARRQIEKLLVDLAAELPGVLWTMPSSQLHITVCEIIQPKPYDEDRDVLYDLYKDRYEYGLAELLATTKKFTITLDTIEVSPQAVILRSSNSDYLNNLRADIVASMPLSQETRTPPDITHSSIARFIKEVDVETVQQVIDRITPCIKIEIDELTLLKNLVMPLEKYEVIQTFPLR